MYRQYDMSHASGMLTGWLDSSAPLKRGWRVSLKKDPQPGRLWTIEQVYQTEIATPPDKSWHVGGL
jgi:hypothetical protein